MVWTGKSRQTQIYVARHISHLPWFTLNHVSCNRKMVYNLLGFCVCQLERAVVFDAHGSLQTADLRTSKRFGLLMYICLVHNFVTRLNILAPFQARGLAGRYKVFLCWNHFSFFYAYKTLCILNHRITAVVLRLVIKKIVGIGVLPFKLRL